MLRRLVSAAFISFALVSAQQENYPDYQDYAEGYQGQDNLYHDYAARQEEKAAGGGGGGGGVMKMVLMSAGTWFLGGKIHSGKVRKKLNKKHLTEQKNLYTQYYNDVYKLQETIAEQQYVIENLQNTLNEVQKQAELEAIQRDYDEFKQPDVDGDDRISRAEFNMYVKNYLSNYPGLQEKDYPKFEDFDHDGDGYVSFQEYAQQMALQVQQAELEQYYAQQSGKSTSAAKNKAEAVRGLYGESRQTDNFNDLYAHIR